jgi:WD40 repeat protein/serine/threonine protein kinase
MSDDATVDDDNSGRAPTALVDRVCDQFEHLLRSGQRPCIEDVLAGVPPGCRTALLRELLTLELVYRRLGGERPEPGEYHQRFPEDHANIADTFATLPDHGERTAPSVTKAVEQPSDATGAPPSTEDSGAVADRAAHAIGAMSSWSGRFRVLRFHDRGALGEVFIARDDELKREVALKQIRDEHADDAQRRARFLVEAEITGGLEHPGIVPVYGLGHHENGRPFYAMRFVKGENLREAVSRFHEADSDPERDPGERGLALRRLLGRFLDVCNAVAYAHSRGVLHRDLKPGNVLLGPFGETLVVDWGLAKLVSRTETGLPSDGSTLLPGSGSAVEGTLPDTILGTPGYMSPEQAAGEHDRLGPRSDVYSLGSTLYYLLTGRSAFPDRESTRILEKTCRGEFPSPRAAKPDVPRGLEAICLKAMALQPADRYDSPRALADDVEHWLADEPIVARPERPQERLARWTRRHRNWVRSALAALLLVSVISIIAALLVNKARMRANEDRLKAARFASILAFEKGSQLAQQGELDSGLLWLARALVLAPTENDLALQHSIRANLGAWSDAFGATLKSLFPVDLGADHKLDLRDRNGAPVALSADARVVAIASGRTAKLWRTDDGSPIGGPLVHQAAITQVAFSPDGRTVLTASEDGTARLWRASLRPPARSPREHQTLGQPMIHRGPIGAVAFSPDGRTVITASDDKTARIWSAADGTPDGPALVHPGPVTAVAVSPDGAMILTGCSDKTVRFWSATLGEPIEPSIVHGVEITGVAFSPDGRLALIADPFSVEVRTSSSTRHLEFLTLIENLEFASFDARGRSLFVVSSPRNDLIRSPEGDFRAVNSDRTVHQWSTAPAHRIGRDQTYPRSAAALAITPDCETVLTMGKDRFVRVWSRDRAPALGLDSEDLVATGPDPDQTERRAGAIVTMAFSRDGRTLVTGTDTGTAQLWDTELGQPIGKPMIHPGPLRAAVFGPDARTVVTISENMGQLWSTSDGKPLGQSFFHDAQITAVAFSPDGTILITGSNDRTARSWSATDGLAAGHVLEHPEAVSAVAFSPDGRTILTRSGAVAQLWNAADARAIGRPLAHPGRVIACHFSPDSRTILTAGQDGTARLWSTANARPIGNALVHDGPITAVAFSPAGRTVLTGSDDKTARLWDTSSTRPIGLPMHHQGSITAVAFSPDGKALLTASDDRTARIWDSRNRQPLGQPMTHQGPVTSAAFCPDGTMILTASSGGERRGQFSFWNAADGFRIGRPEEGIGNSSPWTEISFYDNNENIRIHNGHGLRALHRPRPLGGDPGRLKLWVEVMTGMELGDDQIIHMLDAPAWRERSRRLEALGGPPTR